MFTESAGARYDCSVSPSGPVEKLHVEVFGLPPKNDVVIFVIQVPNAPFGMAWYDGDILTDDDGHGVGDFIGRFNTGTFMVAIKPPASAPNVSRMQQRTRQRILSKCIISEFGSTTWAKL